MIKAKENPTEADRIVEENRSNLSRKLSEIIHGESQHEVVAEKCICWYAQEGRLVLGHSTNDERLLNFMPQLKLLYARIIEGDESPVRTVKARRTNRQIFRLTRLGRDVVNSCKFFAKQEDEGRNWGEAYVHHQFHPVVEVMLRALMHWWLPICHWWDPTQAMTDDGADALAVEQLHQLVDHVRRVCRSQAFENLLKAHAVKAEDNFRSGRDYVIAHFQCLSRLLILRIDLYFRPDAKGWGYSKTADKALSNYLRALRMGRIVPGYRGFIIKRENGISRGMHYHLMVILDGHQHRSAHYLTQLMGVNWMKRVGAAKGSYFNCYARKDLFEYNGLGLVHISDAEKMLGLRIALWYMSKQTCELKVDTAKVKNFWHGITPKTIERRGAPRKDGGDMGLVKSLLGGKRSRYPPGFAPPKQHRAARGQEFKKARSS